MKDEDVSKAAQRPIQSQGEREVPARPLPSGSAQIRVPAVAPGREGSSKKKAFSTHVSWKAEGSAREEVPMPAPPDRAEDLEPKRVQRLHLKMPKNTFQEMIRLQENSDKSLERKRVKKAQGSDKENVANKQNDDLWRDMAKFKEERLFQIDRVVK